MRITKTIAEQVAKKMLAKIKEQVAEVDREKQSICTEYYATTLPDGLLDMFAKHPRYFNQSMVKNANIIGLGKDNLWFGCNMPVTYYDNLDVPESISEKIVAKVQAAKALNKKYDEMYEELVSSLLALRTYANVQKNLPEAAVHLPQVAERFLPSNLTSLKERLSNL